jgi:hypothetical protein
VQDIDLREAGPWGLVEVRDVEKSGDLFPEGTEDRASTTHI